MRSQGWYRDPYGNHDDRWFTHGRPTNLVRDHLTESYDDPPRDWLPDWRWWTVVVPGLLALVLAGSFLSYAAFASASNCFDGCSPVSAEMPVGAAGEVAVAIAVVTLLVAGLSTPAWRRPCAAGLWVAFALACVSAALIATARPTSAGPAVGPSASAVATAPLDVLTASGITGRSGTDQTGG
jgi:hypothetical protein